MFKNVSTLVPNT